LGEVDVAHGDLAGTTPVASEAHVNEVMSINSFPALELFGLSSDFDAQGSEQAASHRIGALWTVCGDSEAVIVRTVQRLVLATRRVLWRRALWNVGSAPIHVESEEYSQLFPATDHPFVKGGRLVIRVDTFD
jgi:hypothetical protein